MDQTRSSYQQPRDISTIVSILPIPVDESKPGLIPSQYLIPGVKDPMKDMETVQVVRARFPVYLDENRPSLIVPAPSDLVADSICRDYKVSMMQYEANVAEPGLFWILGAHTKETIEGAYYEELDKARIMQLMWFKRLVEAADDDWSKYRMRRAISTIQRLAASVLKLEKEWNIEGEVLKVMALRPCKFCFADVHPEAVICSHCRGILNMDRYKKEYQEAVGQ